MIEDHARFQSPSRNFIGTTAAQRAAPVRRRLAFLRTLISDGALHRPLTDERIRAIARVSANLIESSSRLPPDQRLSFDASLWPTFRGRYRDLERLYRQVLTALGLRSNTAPLRSHQLLRLATRLFRFAWEGIQHQRYANHHQHPAFGIALWLSTVELRYPIRARDARAIRLAFKNALTITFAAALAWAIRVNGSKMRVHTGLLLLPEILDSARSPLFANRNP